MNLKSANMYIGNPWHYTPPPNKKNQQQHNNNKQTNTHNEMTMTKSLTNIFRLPGLGSGDLL